MQEQYKEMEEFLGKDYLMVSQEGFEAYLEFMGLGYFKRKIAVNVRPTQSLTRNEDGTYRFYLRSAIFNWEIVFTPGVELESHKANGNKVKALVTFEGNVMTHKQSDDEGRRSTHVLEFFPEETIVVKALVTFEGNVMTHKQSDDEGRRSTHVLEFFPEETIVTTTIEGSVLMVRRVYKLVKPTNA